MTQVYNFLPKESAFSVRLDLAGERWLAGGGERAWRTGARWQVAPEVSLDLEGTRSESTGAEPAQGLTLRGSVRW